MKKDSSLKEHIAVHTHIKFILQYFNLYVVESYQNYYCNTVSQSSFQCFATAWHAHY